MKTYIAFTTKGLENITKQEIKSAVQVSNIIISTKRITFSTDSNPKDLLKLRTVDDLHLKVQRNTIKEGLDFVSKLRKLNNTFSLTVSRYKSNIDIDALKEKLSKELAKELDLQYTPLDHSNFDIRVHAEENEITYSCKLSKESLYNRAYRICERKGALKPTIAAALCRLVPKGKIVDNFCGSGTILCEAKLQGFDVCGGDIDSEAVECTYKNLGTAVKVLDARDSKWPSNYFDCAISNLPWGKQVDLKGIVDLYSKSIKEYARILKKNGSIVLLGIKPDLMIKHLKKNFPNNKIEKFQIGFLGQTPWVVSALSN